MPSPLNVLILEDYPSDAELMLLELRRTDFTPVWRRVDDEPAYLAALDPAIDVILADYTLPQFDALRALSLLKEQALSIPFIVVTASINEEVAVECMKQGAADYLLKDRLGRLGPAVQRALTERRLAEEKQQAELALRQSEERYRIVAELTSDLAYSLTVNPDDSLTYEWGTASIARITGFTPEEIFAGAWQKLIHVADRAALDQHIRALQNGQADTSEFRIVVKGGPIRTMRSFGRPVWDTEQGRVVRVYGAVQDVTEEKRAREQEIRLAQEQTARIEAQEAVRQRNEFLVSLSHGLKNPLARIKGYAQLLQHQINQSSRIDRDSVQHGLSILEETATTMARQINGLVDLAQVQIGEDLQLELRVTDLVSLARQIAESHQRAAERHRIVVEETVPRLIGSWDADRLERVLSNLLENAMKYSPDGGTITVELADRAEDSRVWAIMAVRDEGIGIPADDLPHIFERFHRGSNVVERIPGSGLGLCGARQVVEQHGGTITVESQEGVGSTFTVRLPMIASGLETLQHESAGL